MLELDITDFFTNEDAYNFSASAFEMGNNAGVITWNNAKNEAKSYLHWLEQKAYNGESARDCIIDHFKAMGFSESDEMDTCPDKEIIALLIQEISGDIREAGLDNDLFEEINWQEYERQARNGQISSNIFFVPETQKVYFTIS
jgi:hypothetical protein